VSYLCRGLQVASTEPVASEFGQKALRLAPVCNATCAARRKHQCNDGSQFAVLRLRFGRFRLPRLEIAADPPGNAERHPRQKSLAPELVRPLIPIAIQALSDAHLTQRPSRCEEHRMRRCVDLPSRRCLRDRGQAAAGPEIGVRSSRRGKTCGPLPLPDTGLQACYFLRH